MRPLNEHTKAHINVDAHHNTTGEALGKTHQSVGALVEHLWPALTAVASKYLAENTTPTPEAILTDCSSWLCVEKERVEAEQKALEAKKAADAAKSADAQKQADSQPAADQAGTTVGAPVLPVKGVAPTKGGKA